MIHRMGTAPIRFAAGILAVALAFGAGGCASTQTMSNMWNDATFAQRPLEDVLVIAVRKNATRRRLWEDAFVEELAARHVKATASYQLFESVPDTAQVVAAVRAHGFDGVLVSTRLDPTSTQTLVPGYTTTTPTTAYNPWSNRYYTAYEQVITPAYVETTTVQRFEINVWSTRHSGKMVWSGLLECSEAIDQRAIREGVSLRVLPELEKVELFPARSDR